MGMLAAKEGDQIISVDVHTIMIPTPGGPVPTPIPHPFVGEIDGDLSSDVNIDGKPAATVDSTASNNPPHIPMGGPFQSPPDDSGKITEGSSTVNINGKAAARLLDSAETCEDSGNLVPPMVVVANSTVMIG